MQKTFVVVAAVLAVFFGSYGFAQAAQAGSGGKSNVEKALEQKKEAVGFVEWCNKHDLRVVIDEFAATNPRMTEAFLMRRANANPALLHALQATSKLGIWTVFGSRFSVEMGQIYIDIRASDAEIIKFLKK